jgi:HD superfamily phosphodiesterase
MKRYFKTDFKRIGHATRVARYAERIGKFESGNLAVILPAAYLHDIGIVEAQRSHGSTASEYQEQEGPSVARSILEKLGAGEALIEEVCDIVGRHHHPAENESVNFLAVYDADRIANLEERQKKEPVDKDELKRIIEARLLTPSGKDEARSVLL